MPGENRDKILFQYVMNYKSYRRSMIFMRICVTLVMACGFAGLCAVHVGIGYMLAVTAVFVGVISVLAALGNEQQYNVYADRIVIKKRGNDKRIAVPIADIVRVRYRRTPFEKSLATGTVMFSTVNRGRRKTYRLRHILNAEPLIGYVTECINKGKPKRSDDESRE